MKSLWMIAGAMLVVAGVGGVGAKVAADAARPPQGLAACTSTAARLGLKNAILTRIAARGGETDIGYALSLDTPRLESIDYVADRTICGGTARISVPEYRRAALDGVSELSDPVRFMIEPSRDGQGRVVALVGGGDVIAGWLGATPAPPPAPPAELLRADYLPPEDKPEAQRAIDAESAPEPEVVPHVSVVTRAAAVVRAIVSPPPTPPRRAPEPRPVTRPTAPIQTAATRAPAGATTRLNSQTSPTRRLNTPVPAPSVSGPPVRRAELPPPPASGPSFDCRQSRNAAERAICGDASLAQMDVAMARRYARVQDRIGEKDAALLRSEQREWLRRRDACGTRVCLEMMYETRAARIERMY